ncbi:MAG: hypothetical protein IJG64_03565 [Oscillospiraceae bacterium]|nr:hypothetical protein [Oscillospiraceae bacterium]
MGLADIFRKKTGVSFEAVDSPDKARLMNREGVLERMYLMPLEFGGEDSARNYVLVPRGVNALKEEIDGMIADLVEQGEITGYKASLEYKGKSVVPSKVIIHATKEGKERFTETINIW